MMYVYIMEDMLSLLDVAMMVPVLASIVSTVSYIRCVYHAAMPYSIVVVQQ